MKPQTPPKPKVVRGLADIKFKVGAQATRKSNRRGSIRKLENFEEVRQHFLSLGLNMSQGRTNNSVVLPNNEPRDVPLPNDELSNVDNDGSRNLNAVSSNNLPQSLENIIGAINKNLEDRKKPLRLLNTFASCNSVSRQMLAAVQNKVTLYTAVKDLDTQLEYLYSEFLDCCGLDNEQLEAQSHELRPSLVAEKFNESGEIIDTVEAAFKLIKQSYPDKQSVIDHLDFIDIGISQNRIKPSCGSDVSDQDSSISVALGKGEEYLKSKLPKLKDEVEKRFSAVKTKYEEGKNLSENQLKQIRKQLESLEAKVGDDSPLENLLKDAYGISNFDRKEINNYEDWQANYKALIVSLIESVNESIEIVIASAQINASVAASKSSYNTFLKKQKFSGD